MTGKTKISIKKKIYTSQSVIDITVLSFLLSKHELTSFIVLIINIKK